MTTEQKGELVVFVGFVVAIIIAIWAIWFYTMTPVHEERMYVSYRNWSRTINYIHRWQTEDCDWEDEDDDGDTEWVCETNTHYETLKSWSRAGENNKVPYWPEHPPVVENWSYYLEHHESYYITFHSNSLNRNFVWTIYSEPLYNEYRLEAVALIKLNRIDKIIGVER